MRSRGGSLLALSAVLYLVGCGAKSEPAIPVAVVVAGAPADRASVVRALAASPTDRAKVRVVAPNPTGRIDAAETGEALRIGEVRKKYLAADVDGCLRLVGGPERIERLLSSANRVGAARLLFWRIACSVAGDQRSNAARDAEWFAALGLQVPADARDASPDVENLVDQAIQRVANARAIDLDVSLNVPRGTVRVDGREEACPVPCVVKVAPGSHTLTATADGALPATLGVEVRDVKKTVLMTLATAPPDAAATQWRARYEGTANEQSADSARLLAIATPARYLVLLSPVKDGAKTRLRGLLFFDADVRARAESIDVGGISNGAPARVIDELLDTSKLVRSTPLWKSPLFWLAVAGTAAAASVVTYFALQSPTERTEVRLK